MTISGVSNWFEWSWPIEGEDVGYIKARAMPNIGNWTSFSPAQISPPVLRDPVNRGHDDGSWSDWSSDIGGWTDRQDAAQQFSLRPASGSDAHWDWAWTDWIVSPSHSPWHSRRLVDRERSWASRGVSEQPVVSRRHRRVGDPGVDVCVSADGLHL